LLNAFKHVTAERRPEGSERLKVNKEKTNLLQRTRRRHRVRRRLKGTTERPRLTVFRSHKHLYAQVINDDEGRTLAAASTQDKDLRTKLAYGGNKTAAQTIGAVIAERAKAAGVTKVCFDRREYKYHGRLAALADAAREGGLSF
jgi:large subunit ribosomal protein L18